MKNRPTSRPTMADIAAAAGVSKITVSRALSDSPLVRPELRDRVREIAAQQGYRLNAAARSLRTRRAHSVTAVIEMDPSVERPMTDPLVPTAIGGLLQVLTMRGYSLLLTTRAEVLRSGLRDTDGIILLGQGANDEATRRIVELDIPLVVWGAARPAQDGVVFVGSDNIEGGRLAGRRLAELGRRRLLFLGDVAHPEVADRAQGLREGASGAAITEIACEFSQAAARAAVAERIAAGDSFDGVLAVSDLMALGVLDALREAGREVPADVAVIGFDDTLARDADLTSVRQRWTSAGQVLGEKMLELIETGRAEAERLPVELMVRGSA